MVVRKYWVRIGYYNTNPDFSGNKQVQRSLVLFVTKTEISYKKNHLDMAPRALTYFARP